MDKFRTVECECGNKITYMTLRNKIECQVCKALIDVIPCQPEDFLEEVTTTEETPTEG